MCSYRVSAVLNLSPQAFHRQTRESSCGADAPALDDCDVAVVAVDGAGVVPLEVELFSEAGGFGGLMVAAVVSAPVLDMVAGYWWDCLVNWPRAKKRVSVSDKCKAGTGVRPISQIHWNTLEDVDENGYGNS